jgi:hypothetical protein
MNTNEIVSQIDREIARLTKARELLQDVPAKRGPGRPRSDAAITPVAKKKTKRRKMSAEARARIAAAQKARWAKAKTKKD